MFRNFKLVSTSLFMFCSFASDLFAQTYYNPKDEINITLTVKEPFKPINYYEIGSNLNNTLQQEVARREALKKHYNDIYYDTKAEIIKGTYLTNDYVIDQKIFSLQDLILKNIDFYHNLLVSGNSRPETFESDIRDTYYDFIRDNQIFLNLARYKYQKNLSLKDDTTKQKFNSDFNFVLNNVTIINSAQFQLSGLLPNLNSSETFDLSGLQQILSQSCEDNNINLYKKNWQEKIDLKTKRENEAEIFNTEWSKMASRILEERLKKLDKLEYHERLDYLKSERKFLNQRLDESFMNYHFGKGRKFITSIDYNGALFINLLESQTEKIEQRTKANLFYKYLSEYCDCGGYDSSMFN